MRAPVRLRWLALVVIAGAAIACNSLLGLSDFEVVPDPIDGSNDTSTVVDDAGSATCADGQTSDVDLAVECYPCNPLLPEQLLNACTEGQCIPFDRARLSNLLPDGALPALPPVILDAGPG